MSEKKAEGDKKISISSAKTLSLKVASLSQEKVSQNFSHGRTKSVVVETRKRRITKHGEIKSVAPDKTPKPVLVKKIIKNIDQLKKKEHSVHSKNPNDLSQDEMNSRIRALELAKIREAEDKKRIEEEKSKIVQNPDLSVEQESPDLGAKQQEVEKSSTPPVLDSKPKNSPVLKKDKNIISQKNNEDTEHNLQEQSKKVVKSKVSKPFSRKSEEQDKTSRPKIRDDRRKSKLTLGNALDEGSQRAPSLAAMRRRQEKAKRAQQDHTVREKISREIILPETITIQELSQRMSERSVDVIKFMMKQGHMMKAGDIIDADTAELIADELGHTVRRVAESDVEGKFFDEIKDDPSQLRLRPPVVTIMGHVDHGKTSLLDAIRDANVVKSEAGGITQHIGAYQICKDGNKITFIDTPGHEAFTAMRARGAESTDIAILVVAADDGVMPQTIESINHAKAAQVPIIVAVNKIDKPGADASHVRNELLQHGVFVESMGGDVLEVEVSALKGINLEKLLEAIILQSEILELKANPNRAGEGVIIEAQLDKGRGPVATVLVKHGTLKSADIIVAGNEWGRVRALINDQNKQVSAASPSTPVEVLGLNGTPVAGDKFFVIDSESRAREIAQYRQRLARDKTAARRASIRKPIEQLMNAEQSSVKDINVIVKGDMQGSVEAITGSLEKLSNNEINIKIVHAMAGGITESDVSLALALNTPIIAFNVRANKQVLAAADRDGVEIRYYSIIYNLINDMKTIMSGMLTPERREKFIGYAEILEVFKVSKIGKVAGCLVTEGRVERKVGVRLLRNNVVLHEGKLSTLKRFKDEVTEVISGQECGMGFDNYQDIQKGDIIECFKIEEIKRSL